MFEKTLLVVAYYFPPMGLSGVQRTLKFVKYLPEYGWKVKVLTSSPSSYYAYDDSLLEEINRDEIDIYKTLSKKKSKKTKKFPSYFKQKMGRAVLQTIHIPDSKAAWKKLALKTGEDIIRDNHINAIFATAPPFTDFLVARELSQKYKIPFAVDYRDNWVDNEFHFYPTPFHKNKNIKLEHDILTHAGKVFVTSRYSKELLIKRYRYLSHEDIIIIPHGYDPEDFQNGTGRDQVKFVITHSGVFQDNRTPKYFFKGVSAFLKNNPEAREILQLKFVGLMRPNHLKLIKKTGLENNVIDKGYLPHKDAVREIQDSDVLWLMMNDTIRTPGKLFEYFGARKPIIICSPDGIMRKTALESEAAIATGPDDVRSISKAISHYYHLWKRNDLPVPTEGFTERYNRRILTADLAREIALIADI